MTKEEYIKIYNALISAETAEVHENVENPKVFEGVCLSRLWQNAGEDTMRFGPLKPVGLKNPHCEDKPYAVVQLRRDNAAHSMFNIVGLNSFKVW